jgi:hypothetical protein
MANGSPGASSPTPPPEDLVSPRRAASDSESTQSVLEARARVSSQAVRSARQQPPCQRLADLHRNGVTAIGTIVIATTAEVSHAPFAVGAGEFALALFSSCRSRRNTPRQGARR